MMDSWASEYPNYDIRVSYGTRHMLDDFRLKYLDSFSYIDSNYHLNQFTTKFS